MEKDYKRFTNEEIMECKTNMDKLDELVKNCHGLVIGIAKGVHIEHMGYEFEDKMQIGSMAIVKAVRNFDINQGVDFYTFCHKAVLNTLLREQMKGKSKKVGGLGCQFDYSTLGENDSKKAINTLSLDSITNNPLAVKLHSQLHDSSTSTKPYELYVGRNEEWDFLTKEMNIPQAKLDIFIDYYLNGKQQKEIAKERDVTKQYISKLIVDIEKKIREKYTVEELVARLY